MSKSDIARCKIEANKSARVFVPVGIVAIVIAIIVEVVIVPDVFIIGTMFLTVGALVVVIIIVMAIMHDSCNELK